MANELLHDVTIRAAANKLSQAEHDSVVNHKLANQATGDVIYASSATQLSRLAIGTAGDVLAIVAGVPIWTSAMTRGGAYTITNNLDSASVQVVVLQGDRATPADGDTAFVSLSLSDSAGNQDEQARIAWAATTVLDGATQDGDLRFSVLVNNVLTEIMRLDGANGRLRVLTDIMLNGASLFFNSAFGGVSRSGSNMMLFADTEGATNRSVGISDAGLSVWFVRTKSIGTDVGVTIEFNPDPNARSIASATTFALPRTSVIARTQTLTGSTQVTNLLSHFVVGALTLTDASALTIDKATGIEVTAPVEAGSVTLTMASALRVLNTTGTPTYQSGIIVEALTAGATGNFQILLYNGGTEPTSALADTVGLYCVDIGAAAVLGIVSETAVVTPGGDFALTSKLIVRVNGVSYAIGMTTVLT